MGTNALPNSFFAVIISQGFQTDKTLLSRWPDSDIFSSLDLIALLFQISQKVFKQEGAGNASVHVPAYLAVPRWLSLLFCLPGVIAHSAALLWVLNDGQAMFSAKLVGSLPYEGIGTFAIIVFLSIYKRNGV